MLSDALLLVKFHCCSSAEQPSKRHKGDGDSELVEDMEVETGLFGRSGHEKADHPANPKEKASTSRKDMPKVLHDSSKDSVTVFVSNLSYTMADPEVKLKELFESCGEVAEIRPVFSNKGTFRGYCYVEFKEEKSALQALGFDRKVVEGRPMFVSPCVDKNKNPDFKVNSCSFSGFPHISECLSCWIGMVMVCLSRVLREFSHLGYFAINQG